MKCIAYNHSRVSSSTKSYTASSHCATIHITCRTALINIKHESVAFVCLCGSMIGNKLIETKAIYKARTHGHALTDPRLSSD